jgi:hypothetical protein
MQKGRSIHYKGACEWARNASNEEIKRLSETWLGQEGRALTNDPIDYRGGDLCYTRPVEWPARAMRLIVEYLHKLAVRHGRIIDSCHDARHCVDQLNMLFYMK